MERMLQTMVGGRGDKERRMTEILETGSNWVLKRQRDSDRNSGRQREWRLNGRESHSERHAETVQAYVPLRQGEEESGGETESKCLMNRKRDWWRYIEDDGRTDKDLGTGRRRKCVSLNKLHMRTDSISSKHFAPNCRNEGTRSPHLRAP